MAPKVASRQAQGGPKGLKGISKPPPRQLKIIEKSGPYPGKKGEPGRLQGCPREGKLHKNRPKRNNFDADGKKKCEHFVVFLKHFCCENGGTVPKKKASAPPWALDAKSLCVLIGN